MRNLPLLRGQKDLAGKRVLVRLDLNVPIDHGTVVDDFRIRKSLDTLNFLRRSGARVLAISHHTKDGQSLAPVVSALNTHIPARFAGDILALDSAKAFDGVEEGAILVAENIRFHPEEEANDSAFAARLAQYGDVYVNEAFSASHREHASIVGVPKLLPSVIGLLFEQEVAHLSEALAPSHPFLFILGGVKFGTKLPLVTKFLEIADTVFIGGALAHPILKLRGHEIGTSVSDNSADLSALATNQKILVPIDAVVKNGEVRLTKTIGDIAADDAILDAGPETIALLKKHIDEAAFILWNGPLGDYEHGFDEGTKGLIEAITAAKAKSVVGGGDTLAMIDTTGTEGRFTFVSSGGGAMLDFLADGTLPGIDILQK